MSTKQWVEGIVFKRQNFQENDVLVRIFTKEYGLFTMIVKGAKRLKSRLNSSVLNFSYGYYLVDIKENKISRLNTSKQTKQFEVLTLDIEKSAYATFLCDLVNHAFIDYHAEVVYYDLLKQALTKINENKNPKVITQIFQLKMLSAFGVEPNFKQCFVCGASKGDFLYSVDRGSILCQKHVAQFNNLKLLNLNFKEVNLLRTLALVPLNKVNQTDINSEVQDKISKAIDRLYSETLDLNLKSKRYLDQMSDWLI